MIGPTTLCTPGYKAAVVLNNVGVSLIERHDYLMAHSIVKDALSIMKELESAEKANSAAPSGRGCQPGGRDVVLDLFHGGLRVAMERLVSPCAEWNAGQEQVTATCDQDLTALRSTLFSLPSEPINSMIHPIRIDDTLDSEGDHDHEIKCAIMMYNLGVANLCIARKSRDMDVKEHWLEYSMALFRVAESVLLHPVVASLCLSDVLLDMQRLLVAGIIMATSAVCLSSWGNAIEARRTHHRLSFVSASIQELENDAHFVIFSGTKCTRSAPAA